MEINDIGIRGDGDDDDDNNDFSMIDVNQHEHEYYKDTQYKSISDSIITTNITSTSSSTTNQYSVVVGKNSKYYIDIKSIYQLDERSNTVRKHYQNIESLEEYNKFVVEFNNTFIKKVSIFKNDQVLVEIINNNCHNNNTLVTNNYNFFTLHFFLNDQLIDKEIFFDMIILFMIYFNKKKGFDINKTYKIDRKYICYLKYWNKISSYFPTYMLDNRFIEITFYVNIKNDKEIDIIITTSFTNK